jgi:hypothetical protein
MNVGIREMIRTKEEAELGSDWALIPHAAVAQAPCHFGPQFLHKNKKK